jgi:transcriptional regulator with XRE-family HTH domain
VTNDLDSENQHDPHLVGLGAYLRARRKRSGLTHTQAAAAARLSVAQIQRIESGTIDTRGSALVLLMHAIGATFDDVVTILLDPEPAAEKGRQLGETTPAPVPGDRLTAVTAELERDAARDPDLLPAVAGFLAGRRSRW